MDSKLRLFADPTDRWPALLVAAVLTLLLFAAINAVFSVPGGESVNRVSAVQSSIASDYRI
jgi:hypothetical protein